MAAIVSDSPQNLFSGLFPEESSNPLLRGFSKSLADQLRGKITDDFVELLLQGMELSFRLWPAYRENIKDFTGTYVFRTDDGRVGCSAVFRDGEMKVDEKVKSPYDVRVSFQNAKALWRFLLVENQDILDSIMANDVEVDGNLSYVYKFGYLVRDLQHRLGVA